MEKLDKLDWEKFRAGTSNKLKHEEVVLIAELHEKYFKHKYKVPCRC